MFDSFSTWIKVIFTLPFIFFLAACSDRASDAHLFADSTPPPAMEVDVDSERAGQPTCQRDSDKSDVADACRVLDTRHGNVNATFTTKPVS